MQRLFLAFVSAFFLAVPAAGEELRPGDRGYKHHELHAAYQKFADAVGPGDKGYKKEDLLPSYGKVFGATKCHCSTGQCRPTDYKGSASSPSGVIMLVNGRWCPVPVEAFLTQKDLEKIDVPPELFADPAHICANDDLDPITGCPIIMECAWVNASY